MLVSRNNVPMFSSRKSDEHHNALRDELKQREETRETFLREETGADPDSLTGDACSSPWRGRWSSVKDYE